MSERKSPRILLQPETDLRSDDRGFYQWENRQTKDVLADFELLGVDLSRFNADVERCRKNALRDAKKGLISLTDIDSTAEYLALIRINLLLPSEKIVPLRHKVYYPR